MLASTLDETGGIVTSKFDEWVASEQKTQATIMKSQRQFADERAEEAPGGDAGTRGTTTTVRTMTTTKTTR